MANEIKIKNGTEYSFQSSSYSPTGNNDLSNGTPTVVDLSLSSIASGAAKNSDQLDLGTTRARTYHLIAALEFFSAPGAGETVDFYWSPSFNSSVAVGNPGHSDGIDGAYTGDGGGTVAESVLQMQYIGTMILTDLVGVQIADIGMFHPNARYGQLIIVNNTATVAICATDDIESSILMVEILDEIQ